MAHYHFHIRDGELAEDSEGSEHADVNAAGLEAVRRLGNFLVSRPDALWRDEIISVFVSDDSGLTLFSVDATLACAPAINALRSPPTV